jgi:hypothetical protein
MQRGFRLGVEALNRPRPSFSSSVEQLSSNAKTRNFNHGWTRINTDSAREYARPTKLIQ